MSDYMGSPEFYHEIDDARQEAWELMDVEFDLDEEEMDEDQEVLMKLKEFGFDDEDDLTDEDWLDDDEEDW